MRVIEKHKQFIAWYQRKLGLSDYGLIQLVFFKGLIVALVVERLIAQQMFNQDSSFKYLSSPDIRKTVALGIILVASTNAIFLTYNLLSAFVRARKEREKQ